MPPIQPQPQPQKPGIGRYFKRVSSADPLAGNVDDQKQYTPPTGSKFDFMLNPKQAAKHRFSLNFAGLPRWGLIIGGSIGIIILIAVAASIFGGHAKIPVKELSIVAAQQQELIRVNAVALPLLQQDNTQNLEATLNTTLVSEKKQLLTYFKNNKAKLGTKELSANLNKATDTQLLAARQNNTADQVYLTYVKQQLASYRNNLKAVYDKAGTKGKALLDDAYQSAGAILSTL